MTPQFSPEVMREHRATWFVYAGAVGEPKVKLRHTGQMRGSWWGWDVECSCGEGSHTGGAIKARVVEWLQDHRRVAEQDREIAAAGFDPTDPRQVIRYYREIKGVTI